MKKQKKQSGSIKGFLYRAFYDFGSREFVICNDFLSFLTLLTIVSIVLESVSSLSSYETVFISIEYFAVFFFTLEYIGRLYVNPKPLSYVFSFFGLTDILSIFPTFFHLANFTPLKTARILRILRFLRILRISKIIRNKKEQIKTDKTKDFDSFGNVFKLDAGIYALAAVSATVLFGSLIYVFESHQPAFVDIPKGMMWAVEAFLGGSVSGRVPLTEPGIIIGLFARFIGLILFGFLIHITGGILQYLLLGIKKK